MAGWLRQQVKAAGAGGIVVGLSGGVDSAVVARVSQMAVGGDLVTVMMPAYSDPRDEQDAGLVAQHFKLPVMTVDLSEPYNALLAQAQRAVATASLGASAAPASAASAANTAATESADTAHRLALANVKPRLRMATLYFVANHLNYMVAGTGNRSEIAIGYYTKYGDGGVDLLPLAMLVKSEVRALARELDVPMSIIEKTPSAGLWLGQTDEGEMGFTYGELERYLRQGPSALAPALVMKIERLIRASEHKRHLPPVFEPSRGRQT